MICTVFDRFDREMDKNGANILITIQLTFYLYR